MLSANADIMIRTLTLLFGFAWFTNQSAQFGDTALAANHVLLQFLSFSAFFLDGYAFVVESLVGVAIGAEQSELFKLAVKRTSELSAATALALCAAIYGLGDHLVFALTDIAAVRQEASRYLPLAALYVLCGSAAFQLDGIFIGATRTRAMRNASLQALAIFLIAWWPLTHWLANLGLWLAFTIYVVARAITLGRYLPALWPRSLNR
jgi:MATE family multidrug resistance protein